MSKEIQIPVSEELLLEEIRIILKDYFAASIRKAGDELRIRFAGGETYCLTVWKQSSQKRRGRGAHMRANEINFGEGACPNSSAAKCVGDSCADGLESERFGGISCKDVKEEKDRKPSF